MNQFMTSGPTRFFMFRISTIVLCTAILLSGCADHRPIQFEPNFVYAYATELEIGYSMDQALAEAQAALHEYFGTPDSPILPEFLQDELKQVVGQEKLLVASGSASNDSGRGLFRKHCATCHGETGNGRGPNAAISNPYPRDFRMGKFKFKSTARGAKPLRDNIANTIRKGVPGTTMVRIPELTDADVAALVDYVIYLSWRGEVERELLKEAAEIEFEAEDPEVLKNLFAPGSPHFEEQQVPLVHETIVRIGETWLSAGDQVKEIPSAGEIPTNATPEELRSAATAHSDSPLKASIERGKELFESEITSCSKCHGKAGHGDGQTQDYDDWTKDWTTRINLDPTDEALLIPLMARGALPARKILPRDFREGVYRGGATPEAIFQRIYYGIDGTPMPALEGVVSVEDTWHLVNFVRSLAEAEITPSTNTP